MKLQVVLQREDFRKECYDTKSDLTYADRRAGQILPSAIKLHIPSTGVLLTEKEVYRNPNGLQ